MSPATATATATSLPIAHADQLDEIEQLLAQLEQSIQSLVDASWGAADDGTTSRPCADGTGADYAKRLIQLATAATAICEHREHLAQPGDF